MFYFNNEGIDLIRFLSRPFLTFQTVWSYFVLKQKGAKMHIDQADLFQIILGLQTFFRSQALTL